MQRLPHRCPRCDQPLGISWDMWGKYYLCGECGFTAEDDDELTGTSAKRTPPLQPDLTQIEVYRLRQTAARK